MSLSQDQNSVSNVCCVCLCKSPSLVEITTSKISESESWISKLKKCVPEINWTALFVICLACSNQLDFVCNFRQLCLQSDETRQKLLLSQDIKNESIFNADYNDVKYQENGRDNKDFHSSDTSIKVKNYSCENCDIEFLNQSELDEHNRKLHKDDDSSGNEIDKDYDVNDDTDSSSNSDPDTDDNLEAWSQAKRKKPTKQTTRTKAPKQPRKSRIQDAETEICKTKYVDLKCHGCQESFETVALLVQHSTSEHKMLKKDIKPYVCPKCPWRFRIPYSLRDHIKFHDNIRNEICSYCGKGFVTKIALITHEKQHLNLREYQCPHCPKRFNTSKDIRTHKYVVHTDPSRWKHVCPVCNKRFPVKSNFDAHVRRHNNEKPYGCHLCSAKFCEGASLRIHIQRHSNVREYKCKECGNEYKTLKYLQQHKNKKHTVGAKISEPVKKYVCTMCPKAFYAKNKLTRHMCTHTGERPFACTVCDKRFTDKSYVTQHMKTVHNYMPECDL